MTTNAITNKRKTIGEKIRTWQAHREQYRMEQINHQQAQFIATLQKRYGYTKEKAIYELHKNYSKVRHG